MDQLLSIFSPQSALDRTAARMRFGIARGVQKKLSNYAGAERSRHTGRFRDRTGMADLLDLPDIKTMLMRARQMCRDNGDAQSALGSYSRNVVGEGIQLRAKAIGNEKWSKDTTNKFWDWASKPALVDSEGALSLFGMQRLKMEQLVEAGEVFTIKTLDNTRKPGQRLVLQMMEPEDLCWSTISNPANGNEVRGGIEVNKQGRAVAYHFLMNQQLYRPTYEPTRIPAERVVHLFKKKRPHQSHGVTWFHPILRKLGSLDQFDEYKMQQAAIEACVGLLINTQDGGTGAVPTYNPQTGEETTDSAGNQYAEFDGAMVFRGKPGETVSAMVSENPNSQYSPYVQSNLRRIAAGLNLSYETVARDFTQGSYSSLRQSLLEDRRGYGVCRQMMIEGDLQPIYAEWLFQAVLDGSVVAPKFLERRDYWEYARWHGQGWEWINPVDEVNAYCKAIDYRLKTREDIIAATTGDRGEVLEQIEAEAADAKAKNLFLPEEKEGRDLKTRVLEGFIADGSVCDLVANATNIGQLVEDAGLPREADYVEPFLPVTDENGAVVTGDVLTDPEGDVVGGVSAPAPSQPAAPSPSGETGNLRGVIGGVNESKDAGTKEPADPKNELHRAHA